MRQALRPSIFRYLLYILIVISVVVTSLLLLANQVVHRATGGLEEVVVHQGLITSRSPDDLEAFCSKIVEETREGRHEHRVTEAA